MNDRFETETIFALASGAGKAGVAVLRVSGAQAFAATSALTGRDLIADRRLRYTDFSDPATGEILDHGLAVGFEAPNSFTGENVVEIHMHGGRSVVAGVLDCLGRQPGLRLAEPGEFTRRAFENDKLDLTAAEALADLVDAETADQRRQALRQLDGSLGDLCEGWRARLVAAVAHFEVEIDFSDEDLPSGLADQVARDVKELADDIGNHLRDEHRGQQIRDGLRVALIGAPNAGKSSLLNRLAGRDAAIVSDRAGTTRDVIEVRMDMDGFLVTLADTAGLRDSDDDVEAEGVRRARLASADADIRLAVVDVMDPRSSYSGISQEVVDGDIVVLNKSDLGSPSVNLPFAMDVETIPVSAKTGMGIDDLLGVLRHRLGESSSGSAQPIITRLRHRRALEACADALARFDVAANAELAAEDLRLATRSLGSITGRVGVEDVLDVVFGEFCIGK